MYTFSPFLQMTSCPVCIEVRVKQGFAPPLPRRELSASYLAKLAEWEASKPVFERPSMFSILSSTSSAETQWIAEHPPPQEEYEEDEGELCSSCAEWKANQDYIASDEYQAWLSSMPQNMTMEEQIEWMTTNPPPSRKEEPV